MKLSNKRAVNLMAAVALSATAGHVDAALVTLKGSDAFGESSFATAGNQGAGRGWSVNAAPSAGNDYSVTGFTLRTANNGGSQTFAGDSLTLNASSSLQFKNNGGTTITVNNLTVAGNATIANVANTTAVGEVRKITLAGSNMVVNAVLTLQGLNSTVGTLGVRDLDITAGISGTGSIVTGHYAATPAANTIFTFFSANSYDGTTTAGAATTIRLGNSHVLPNGLGKGNVIVNGELDVFGKTETINGLSGSGFVSSSSGTGNLSVGDNNATSSFAGVIRNSLNLTKVGSGTLTLTNTQTYTGDTTVSGGILDVNGALASNGANKVFIAKDANDDFTNVAAPELQRAVGALSSLAGIGATEVGGLGTVASLIGGSTNAATSVDMAFRGRNDAIVAGETSLLSSDILQLEGLDGVVFVLQMSYSEAAALANGQAETTLKLGYLNTDTNQWMNAIDGNHGTNIGSFFLSSYTDAGSPIALGSYGVDIVNNVVWAVLDHNSFFAVIPTPGALPAGALLMGLVVAAKRRRQA